MPRYGRTYAVTVILAALCIWFLAVAALIAARARQAPSESALVSADLTVEDARGEFERAHRQVLHARAEAAAAKAQLDELLAQSVDARRAAADDLEPYGGHRGGVSPQRTTSDISQPAAGEGQESYLIAIAERDALVTRLHELLALRDRLQGQLTPRHPQLREVEAQSAEAARRLAVMQIPTFVPPNGGQMPSDAPNNEDHVTDADRDMLRAELARAEEHAARAAAAEQQSVEQYVAASERLSAAMLRVNESEQPAATSWALVVLWISLVLVGLAGINFLRQAKGTFPTIGSVRAWLDRPIVGVLSGPRPRWATGYPSSATAAMTSLVVASEATLCFAAFVVAAALVVNLALLPQMLTDPLGAIQSGAQQLWHAGR